MTTSQPTVDDPVTAALAQLSTGFDDLLALADGGGLDNLDHTGLLGVLREFERFRNRLSVLDHRLIGAAERTGLAEAMCQPNVKRVLVQALRISEREAKARVVAAEVLGDQVTLLGQRVPPRWPALAAAQAAGQVSPEQVTMIERPLSRVDIVGFDPAQVALGEQVLAEHAAVFGPRQLKPLIQRVIDWIHPDGSLPGERLNRDRRFLTLSQTPDGAYVGEFRLTATAGAKLAAILAGLANPRIDRFTGDGDSPLVEATDQRSQPQRLHDALEEVCDRILRAGDAPGIGGTPATVIVTIDHETLLSGTGWATTSDGTPISTGDLVTLAGEADILPTVLSAAGAALDLGRSRRCATREQVWALVARDGGCSFPTCDRPPEWCEKHHIVPWAAGGNTDLDNLTFLCSYHHHHFEQRGWTCEMNPDRLPHWRPPQWIHSQQTPLMNPRVGRGLHRQLDAA